MSQLVKEYLHVIYEHQGKMSISFEEYHDFVKSAIKFDKNLNVILEDSEDLIDIPSELIRHFISNKHSVMKSNDIKFFLKKSRHWQNIKNVQINDIYFDLFDFNDPTEIDRFNYNCFKIEDGLLKYRNDFIENLSKAFGFYSFFNNIHIVCANTNSYDVFQTIHHELSHLIQHIGNIRIVKGLSLNEVRKKDILKTECI